MASFFDNAVGPDQLLQVAESALRFVSIVRQSLPVKGDVTRKSNLQTIDRWFSNAGDAYTTIERIRNPNKLPWPGPRGTFFTVGPADTGELYQEICDALEPIVETYGWQGISDESCIAHSSMRDGRRVIPEIDARLLDALEVPAAHLLELLNELLASDSGDDERNR